MIDDRNDRRLALRAPGLLAIFNRADVLSAADVHVATRLGVMTEETDEQVLLATALAVRAVRQGSTCLDLTTVADVPLEDETDAPEVLPWPEPEAWAAAVAASPLVRLEVLRFDNALLYLDRYWREEVQVCHDVVGRLDREAPEVDSAILDAGVLRVFPDEGYDEQRDAVRQAARRWTTVLTGGPGTGKTTTVAGLLALLAEQAEQGRLGTGRNLRIALSAPTGKASARLQQSVEDETRKLPQADRDRLAGLQSSHPAPAARLAARQQHPVPAQPDQPAAPRRDRGRRDLDGVAHDDGPAARGGSPGHPAGAGRRPRSARLGRGGCRAGRPGRRVRPALRVAGGSADAPRTASAGRSPTWPRRCATTTPTRVIEVLRSGRSRSS